MTTESALIQTNIEDYSRLEPLPDPPKEPDMWQRSILNSVAGALLAHFADRRDVLVCGEGYLRHDANEPGGLVPDCAVTYGLSDPRAIIQRNGYVISEVGKPPDFVLEVASRSTGRRDYTVKREGYAALGVREYWRFDPTGGMYHDTALAGDALLNGEYMPVEIVSEPDGRHWGYSEVLRLELWWEEEELRFRNPETGEFLPMPEELQAAREAAEARIVELESELRRLRGER